MALERIGHGGASALERGNTLASFDAARAVGIDHIEFDVRSWRGELVLAHTRFHPRLADCVGLRDALRYLAGASFADIGLHLDVKRIGCESEILEHLREAGVFERTLVCSQIPIVLDRFRALDPEVRLGISVGRWAARVTHRPGSWQSQVLAGLASGRWNVLMVQHRLVDRGLVKSVSEHGARLYAWTVNERRLISSLGELGVHGIATSDPRLFLPA
ncbi:MAG TPA: glycerophosphodiester phosphodiesterase [Solirubrobacteraceae bacterium]|jgi:glycerophosphoryl diester phosphodiesterase|nr:glycerophosphodiester phosphodiesterase [Solirubrobacteraceae bacterium]